MRILIANRALSALKFVTSINEWLRLETVDICMVGVVTEEDMESGYKYIEMLDEVVMCENGIYMNGPRLVEDCLKRKLWQKD